MNEDFDFDKHLIFSLFEHQKETVNWIIERYLSPSFSGGLIKLDAGLGKTLISIAFIIKCIVTIRKRMIKNGKDPSTFKFNSLIIAPASLTQNWVNEFIYHVRPIKNTLINEMDKQLPLNVSIHLPKSTKLPKSIQTHPSILINELETSDVHIISYTSFLNDVKQNYKNGTSIINRKWNQVFMDEAHNLKNIKAKIFKAVNLLHAHKKWLITATPIINKLDELYAYVHILKFYPYTNYWKWKNDVVTKVESKGKEGYEVVNRIMDAICISKNKSILNLPPKKVFRVDLPMSEIEFEVYKFIYDYCQSRIFDLLNLADHFSHLGLSIEEKLVKSNIGPFLTKMRSAACHPLLPLLQFKNLVNNHNNRLDFEQLFCSEDGIKLAMKWINQNKDTQCLLCLDGEPHFICYPCGHSFCHNCMAKILKLNEGEHCLYCAKLSTGYKLKEKNDESNNTTPLLNGSAEISPLLSPQFINDKKVKEILQQCSNNLIITVKMKWIINKIREIDNNCNNHNQGNNEDKQVHWLIFSQYTKPLDILNHFLSHQGISTMQIDGRTKKDTRTELIQEYQSGKYKVALLSLLAAGVGITLTRATKVIMFEPYWSDSLEDQGSDRCHRIGQTESVTVYNLCYKETVESNVFTMKDMKKEIVDGITGKRKYELTSCNYANHVRLFMNSSILSQKVRRQ